MKNSVIKKVLTWFTIVEILVWVTLLAILWAWAYSVVSNSKEKTNAVAMKDSLWEIFKAVDNFKRDTGAYPAVTDENGNAIAANTDPLMADQFWFLSTKWSFSTYLVKQKTDANWMFIVWADNSKVLYGTAWNYFAIAMQIPNSEWQNVWRVETNAPVSRKNVSLVAVKDWELVTDAIARWIDPEDGNPMTENLIPIFVMESQEVDTKTAKVTLSNIVSDASWTQSYFWNAAFTFASSTWTAWTKAWTFVTNWDWSALTDYQTTVRFNFTNDVVWIDSVITDSISGWTKQTFVAAKSATW